jgi:hypothetical protein
VVGIQRERQLPLFRYYDPEYKWPNHERVLCERVAPPLPDLEPKFVILAHTCAWGGVRGAHASLLCHRPLVQLLVECQALTLQFGQIEPFFCSFALYDLGKRTKISENFYFDRNHQSILSKLGRHLVRSAFFAFQLFSVPLPLHI